MGRKDAFLPPSGFWITIFLQVADYLPFFGRDGSKELEVHNAIELVGKLDPMAG